MDLFGQGVSQKTNLLPADGTVNYLGIILSPEEADHYFKVLFESIAWKNDEARIFGKLFITKRKAAWYGNSAYRYTYSNTTKEALPWTPELLELKQLVEERSGATFNSCLLNLYHSGDEGINN